MAEATGLKTKFYLGATQVTLVSGITPPQPQRETVDVEDLDPLDGFKKKLIGLIDGGEMSLTINFDPEASSHQACEAALYSGALQTCKIKYPNGKGYTFTGYVIGFAPQEIAASEVMQAEITIAVTSKPTYGVIA